MGSTLGDVQRWPFPQRVEHRRSVAATLNASGFREGRRDQFRPVLFSLAYPHDPKPQVNTDPFMSPRQQSTVIVQLLLCTVIAAHVKFNIKTANITLGYAQAAYCAVLNHLCCRCNTQVNNSGALGVRRLELRYSVRPAS